MPRTTGSDELYRLIHSLSSSEKGYFQKYAQRHTTKGTAHLKLFNAIATQKKFEEASLKKKLKNYPVVKVHLYEMLTDALLIYNRHTHPHISLLNQMQKIHLLFIKGMYAEAISVIEKARKQSREMELFPLEQYLHRLHFEMMAPQLNSAAKAREVGDDYRNRTNESRKLDENLVEWEMTHLDWLCRMKTGDHYKHKEQPLPFDEIEATPALSIRSKLRKLFTQQYMLFIKPDGSMLDVYNNSKDYTELSSGFRKTADASFGDVGMQYVHATNTMHLHRFEEAIEVADQMMRSEEKARLYYPLAFVRGNLVKLNCLFHLSRIREAVELLKHVEKELIKTCLQFSNDTDLRHFYFIKLTLLLCNKQYTECWVAAHDLNVRKMLESSEWLYADYLFLELILQFEMGNFEIIQGRIKKVTAELKKRGVNDFTFNALLQLFKKADAANARKLCQQTSSLLEKEYAAQKAFPRTMFSKLSYLHWLQSKSTGKSLENLLHEKAKRLEKGLKRG
ncbi:MAG: hypothetical protein V4615_12575 [Bacteroidota bacterium]